MVAEKAVKECFQKQIRKKLFKNLHVYVGGEHKHEAQQPKEININEIK